MPTDPSLPLPVLGFGVTIGEDGRPYPTVVVDPTGRPDVADLGRVHATEGVGDVATSLALLEGGGPGAEVALTARLAVACSSPVRCGFVLDLPLPACRPLLDDVATAEVLLVATAPPREDGGPNPPWLAVDVRGDAVAAALRTADERGAG